VCMRAWGRERAGFYMLINYTLNGDYKFKNKRERENNNLIDCVNKTRSFPVYFRTRAPLFTNYEKLINLSERRQFARFSFGFARTYS